MAYLYDVPNMSDGMDNALVGIAGEVSIFIPMFLFFVWLVIFLGGSQSQKRRTGSADMGMWATVSSLAVLMITLALTITSGLVNMLTLVIVVIVTILSGAWLFLDRTNKEI
jgi:F0F1-type ATP synthase assembly protein I